MKTQTFLAILMICAGSLSSCTKREDNPSQGIYYVVGYDGTSEVNDQKGTAKSGGYLLISEEYKDLLLEDNLIDLIHKKRLDDIILLANNLNFDKIDDGTYGELFDGIIDFPAESMPPRKCSFTLFPEEYHFAFKVQMTYRIMTEEEIDERYTTRIVNAYCYNPLNFVKFKDIIIITSISKIQ